MNARACAMRWALAALALGAGVVVGAWLGATPQADVSAGSARAIDPRDDPAAHEREQRAAEVARRFAQAVAMLHARQYEHATTALHRVLELAPTLPEAHVNMGFALLGLARFGAARDFFASAAELRPEQANAYYGLAVAYEGLRDLPPALGAMRTYLHLARADDPHRSRARAALWEWEEALGRHRPGAGGAPPGERR